MTEDHEERIQRLEAQCSTLMASMLAHQLAFIVTIGHSPGLTEKFLKTLSLYADSAPFQNLPDQELAAVFQALKNLQPPQPGS